MTKALQNITVLFAIMLTSFSAVAPITPAVAAGPKKKLDSYIAYLIDQKEIMGEKNVDKVLTIASVSKLFTSQWALHKLKPKFKFQVNVYKTPVHNKPGFWNVHLSSDYHPYFEKPLADKIIAHLIKSGIKNVELLSFDEGVKFVRDAELKEVKWGDHPLDYPSTATVRANLGIFKGRGIKIQKIDYWPSRKSSKLMGYKPIENKTQVETFYSDTLVNLLHRMNMNSNNHAANQVFNKLGGAKAYEQYAPKVFGFKPGKHVMLNGSGNPIFINGKKQYGRSTSKVVVQALAFLHAYMKFYGGISHVLALAKPTQEQNTLKMYYTKAPILKGRLIAKTGTTWDAITLGGILSTKRGPMAFYFNIDINSKPEASAAVDDIRKYLVGMLEYMGPGPVFK